MRLLLTIFLISFTINIFAQEIPEYPKAPKCNQTDTIFGEIIKDPYRPLENTSEETLNWLEKQEDLIKQYRKREWKHYSKIYDNLSSYNYVDYTPLIKEGKYYYFYQYNNRDKTAVLYRQEGYYGYPYLLINPNTFVQDNEEYDITNFEVSNDEKYLAFSMSNSGSDWREIRIRNNKNGKNLNEILKWVKYSDIGWKDDGFFYWKYDKPKSDNIVNEILVNQKLYYHKVNTKQEEDSCYYKIPDQEFLHSDFQITSDEKYMILYTFRKLNGEWVGTILYKNLDSDEEFKILLDYPNEEVHYTVLDHINGKFFLVTDHNADNGRFFTMDIKSSVENELIPEYDYVLEYANIMANKILGLYFKDGIYSLIIFDLEGKPLIKNDFEEGFYVSGFNGDNNDSETIYSVKSFYFPSVIYSLDLVEFSTDLLSETGITYDHTKFETRYIKYPSKDGTMIPMYLTYKKDLNLSGKNNPTLLYGYGGFGTTLNPFFDAGHILFMNSGGVLATPQIRGGGEFGKSWHDAGRVLNKQNTFDDFISAAEFLININLTSKDLIAINGGSHGGLLVGASMTQRPDLFKVAIPEMGVFDMIRKENFGIAYIHHDEYGSVSDSIEFLNLLSYSPLHNLKSNVDYPATLVITSDNDDRVQPLHSFKYIANLQEVGNKTEPYLIYLNKESGHYGPSTISGKLKSEAFKYCFIFKHLNMKPK